MKKLTYLILIFVFQTQAHFCQNTNKVDSLKQAFNTEKGDIEKVELGNLIFLELKHKAPEEALIYVNKMLSISKQNALKKGIGMAYHNKGYYYRFKPNSDSSRYYFKKSIEILKQNSFDKALCKTCEDYATFECVQGNYDTAIKIADLGYDHAKKIKNGEFMAVASNRKSTTYMDSGNFEAATRENIIALKIIDTLKLKKPLLNAISLGHKARIEMLRGNYNLMLAPLLESLNIAKKTNNKTWEAVTLMEIGNAHWYLENYDDAIKYYEESLNTSKEIKRNDFISMNLSNISSIYADRGHFSQAIKTLKESIQVEKKIGSKINLTIAYNTIAEVYNSNNNFNEAIKFYNKGIKLADSIEALDVSASNK